MKSKMNDGIAFALFVVVLTCYSLKTSAQTTVSGSITYQTFYDNLAPYGTWIEYPGYGHVWSPKIEGDFRPYLTNGNWIYSNEGWAWSSNYSWGWAPFHYGRWVYDDLYGWLWVPGYDWSPAWVTWGFVDNYYAWAPLMPGVNVELQFSSWRPHAFYWNFCNRERIYDKNLSVVITRPEHINALSSHISIINNFSTTRIHNFYATGPAVSDVEKFTNRKIDRVAFSNVNDVRLENKVSNPVKLYRPDVENPRPRSFKTADADRIKPLRSIDEWPSLKREEQRNNVQHLPMHHDGFVAGNKGGGGVRTKR